METSVNLTQTISSSQLPSHLNSKRGGGGGGSWWETGADRPELVAGGAAGAGATLAHTLVTSARTAPALLPFRCEAQQAAGSYFPAKPGHDRAASEGPWKWAPTCGPTLWLHTVVLWLSRANKACDSAALNEAPMASAPRPALLFPPYYYLIPTFDISSNRCKSSLN